MGENPAPSEAVTPETVTDQFEAIVESMDDSQTASPFRELFSPASRTAILDALLTWHPESPTAREICDMEGIGTSTFDRQIDFMLTAGIVQEHRQRGNAMTYKLNINHPVSQLLRMLDVVFRHGVTPMILDEQFIGEPGSDYVPGDHPNDPR